MIDYRAGVWGLHVCIGWHGSLAPRALTMAIPNAALTFTVATWFASSGLFSGDGSAEEFNADGTSASFITEAEAKAASAVMASFNFVMIFILYNRSRTSYNRWWEGGTLLQKTRGEWFNAYSSIMAFTSTDPKLECDVNSYCHLLARLFSLLMCCGLQQVSPHRDRPFEIIDLAGIEPESMEFLNAAPDKVEVILQWIQRSMVLHVSTGVLPVAPPILSRAFQEVSRGIVNLQNARKIADFPYPFPLAQICMILQLLHWAMTPIACAIALPRGWATLISFFSIFVLWCIHFNALDLEFPFGSRVNDLPMNEMQQDWNSSIMTLLDKNASRPPMFTYDADLHEELDIVMSDASALYVPVRKAKPREKGVAAIKVTDRLTVSMRNTVGGSPERRTVRVTKTPSIRADNRYARRSTNVGMDSISLSAEDAALRISSGMAGPPASAFSAVTPNDAAVMDKQISADSSGSRVGFQPLSSVVDKQQSQQSGGFPVSAQRHAPPLEEGPDILERDAAMASSSPPGPASRLRATDEVATANSRVSRLRAIDEEQESRQSMQSVCSDSQPRTLGASTNPRIPGSEERSASIAVNDSLVLLEKL